MARRARKKRHLVLIVDDHPDELSAVAADLSQDHEVRTVAPAEVEQEDVDRASVVLVDLKIDDAPIEVDHKKRSPLVPGDGIALASALRSNAKRSAIYALHSGKLDELGGQPYSIARARDLEWAFSKAKSGQMLQGVTTMIDALNRLPKVWDHSEHWYRDALRELLSIPTRPAWTRQAKDGVDAASPPSHETSAHAAGMPLIRWLLQDVLPFPTFLLDEVYLAARLRVTPESMRDALKDAGAGQQLRRALALAQYKGILANFSGTRWWRAGVDSLIWKITDGNPFDPGALRDAVARSLSSDLETVSLREPVVVLDDKGRPTKMADLTDAVQVRPDDWPDYADFAWACIRDAEEDPSLRAIVVPQDRSRLAGRAP